MVSILSLIWDDWNVAHIAVHQVSKEEVEEVCLGDPMTSQTHHGRIRVVGPTARGRMVTVILAPKGPETYYPVTARLASRKERRLYTEDKGGEQAA